MNSLTARTLGAQALIAVTVVGALHLGFVEPMRQRAQRASAGVQSAQARLAEATSLPAPVQLSPSQREAGLEDLRRLARWFDARNRAASDPLLVYEGVRAQADGAGVQMARLEPTTPVQLSAAPRGRKAQNDDTGVTTLAFELDAVGAFPGFIDFLDAIERGAGFTRVTGFTFEPMARNGKPLVRASIRTSHFAFGLADAEALTGGQHAALPVAEVERNDS